MSALFGHVKGAFTGATGDRAGLLRAANGGMLFLDEIGELGLDEQAMILRAHRGEALPAGRRRQGGGERLPADRRHQPRPRPRGRARAASARTCWRASTCGPSRCRACASAARTSSRTSTSSWTRFAARDGEHGHLQQGGARSAICAFATVGRGARGRPISAISARRSRAWRRWRRRAASPRRSSTRRSSACAAGGAAAGRDPGRGRAAARGAPSRRSRRSTCSTACSWPRSSAYCREARSLSDAGRAPVRRVAPVEDVDATTPTG